jgi:hypothetical protein
MQLAGNQAYRRALLFLQFVLLSTSTFGELITVQGNSLVISSADWKILRTYFDIFALL